MRTSSVAACDGAVKKDENSTNGIAASRFPVMADLLFILNTLPAKQARTSDATQYVSGSQVFKSNSANRRRRLREDAREHRARGSVETVENRALAAAARTWTGEWWKYGGGGSLWDGLSYDPDANLIYVGTGNGAPWPGILRGSEGADNLYVSSILAVHADSGELAWHYQVAPGDSWDIDSVQQLILADITIDGRERKVLMQASKGGFFYVLDRITGEFISATPFAPLNWASGHDPKTGRPIINKEALYTTTQPAVISPASGGAANWAAKAYSPTTKLVYMPVSGFSSRTYVAIPVDLPARGAVQNNGTPRGGQVPATTSPPVTPPFIGPGREARGGFLVAFDPATRTERWRIPGGGGSGGGALVTAGNLVFQVVPDGRLRALNVTDGATLWEVQTGQRGLGPPITYQIGGRQQISFMAGASQGPLPPTVYTFALDGKLPMPGR